jgi:hypothetical protein
LLKQSLTILKSAIEHTCRMLVCTGHGKMFSHPLSHIVTQLPLARFHIAIFHRSICTYLILLKPSISSFIRFSLNIAADFGTQESP